MDFTPNQLPPLDDPNGAYNTEQIAPQPIYYQEPSGRKGMAIAALVLGIVSLIGLCCCIGVFTAPLALIFGIISLAKKYDGKGMAITGIILGGLTLILSIAALIALRPVLKNLDTISQDITQLLDEQDTVFPAYEQDSTQIPGYMKKYLEPPYSDMLAEYDLTVYDVMDALLVQYKSGRLPRTAKSGPAPTGTTTTPATDATTTVTNVTTTDTTVTTVTTTTMESTVSTNLAYAF